MLGVLDALRGRARSGHRAPRPEAVEHPARRRRPRARDGLRHRRAPCGTGADGRDRRHARLHVARGGARRGADAVDGRLRGRRDARRTARAASACCAERDPHARGCSACSSEDLLLPRAAVGRRRAARHRAARDGARRRRSASPARRPCTQALAAWLDAGDAGRRRGACAPARARSTSCCAACATRATSRRCRTRSCASSASPAPRPRAWPACADEILKDVALTNKLLRLVNTAHFTHGGGGGISTVSRAVALVGFAGIRNMALSLVLLEHMQRQGAQARSCRRSSCAR